MSGNFQILSGNCQGILFPLVCWNPARGHIFSPIIMKLDEHFCLDEITDDFEMVHVGSKARSLVQMFENLVYALKALFSV